MEMSLDKLAPGQKGRILALKSSGAVHRRLLDMGITRGTVIGVEKVAPLGDPIEIKIRGYNLSLRKEEAVNIIVEVV